MNEPLPELTTSLDGRKIVGIDVSDEERALRFRCEDGTVVVWDTWGDCCSQSWWADGYNLNELRGATVRTVIALELGEPDDNRTRQEFDQAYGYEVFTDKGSAKLVFRNSSNGYYGGWAGLGSDFDAEWREIEGSDWRA